MSIRPTPLLRRAALCAALFACVLGSTPAFAEDDPSPPASMSDVGGERLADPGVQADYPRDLPLLPESDAWSFLVADADTGDVLAAKNPHWALPPASTLKMLFADTVLPGLDANQTHTVLPADLAGMGEGSSQVGIKENLTYKVSDLWRGVFLRSGNDAVHVLCAMNGGVQHTVDQMQQLARRLQADDTHVRTPDGYDADGQVSSAYDLALFAREGMHNPDFRSYAGTRIAQFPGGGGTTFQIQNTNQMLGQYPGMIGVKNGYTTNAQNTFVGMATRDGHTMLIALMHVEGTYEVAAKMLDWAFAVDGRARPIGTLVSPPAASPSATPDTIPAGGPGGGGTRQAAATSGGSSVNWGLYAAVGVPLVVLLGAGGVWLVRRSTVVGFDTPPGRDDVVR